MIHKKDNDIMFIVDVDPPNKLECVWQLSPKHKNRHK